MSQQPSTEERLATLESRVAELEQRQHLQDDINGALLIRIDAFIGNMHLIERDQRRGFDELRAGQKNLEARMDRIEEGQQSLQAGMDQVVAILTGRAKTND